jgi:hypothetical protein
VLLKVNIAFERVDVKVPRNESRVENSCPQNRSRCYGGRFMSYFLFGF